MYNVKSVKGASWGLIIFLFFIFAPVGIGVMMSKLHKEKDDYVENGKIVAKVGWFFLLLGVFSLILWNAGEIQTTDGELASYDSVVLMFLVFFIGGVLIIRHGKKYTKRGLAQLRYGAIIANLYTDSLDDIAVAYPKRYEEVCKDLQELFKDGFFSGCSLDLSRRKLIAPGGSRRDQTRTTTANQTTKPKEATPKVVKVVKCPNCGATNTVRGTLGECEYCSSPLT